MAIIGGGPGGVYTAWRLAVDSRKIRPSDVCVFERAARVGGRTFSLHGQGTRKDLTVDIGAYRFCGNLNATNCSGCDMCMPMMSNLIRTALGLHVKPYEPGGKDNEAKMVKIVGKDGANAGLAVYVDAMRNASESAGVRYFIHHEAISILAPAGPNSNFTVSFKCDDTSVPCFSSVTARRVVLNTPLMPATKLLRASPSLKKHFDDAAFPSFLRVPYPIRHVKFYVHYDWAWWRALGKTFGYFTANPGCSHRALQSCNVDVLPLDGRYHDGPVRCEDGNETGLHCRGFIEATYTSDGISPSAVNFFTQYQTHTDPPYVVVDRESSIDGEDLLRQAHEQLVALHKNDLERAGLYADVVATKPTMALLSLWDPKAVGIGAGTHVMGNSAIPGGAYAPGAAAGTVAAKAVKPFKSLELYIANEAFHPSDFGEGSLEMAENVAHRLGAASPKWMASETYEQILFGAPEPDPNPTPAPSLPHGNCSGPFGGALPDLLRNRPSGTPVPNFFVMAAPFTPFHPDGSVNLGAILPLAHLFKERLGINSVWVMGMRGQFDTLTVAERKAVAAAWISAGKATGLFTIIHCGDDSNRQAAEIAAYVESIGGDAVASLGPYEELCGSTECVVDFVAPVAASAPKTPFFYYHTPGWNGKGLNGVKMYDWFKLAATKIPTAVGVKFESYDDSEFAQTCAEYGDTKVMIYAPCNSLGHWEQGRPGRGTFIQAFLGPMCHRIKAAYERGDTAGMKAEADFLNKCKNAGGNYIERYFYRWMKSDADFGHPRSPQPHADAATLEDMNQTLHECGFYNQSWPPSTSIHLEYV
eukprot:TRINITY_DN25552_c0_g1_i1.p1 TRINITY_DN25552_c0_g1~~TRINITY_DN25552_c0_g1_i1.p1  ORF type:complete len:864 (-),score=63.11 TRINITY_DN25552_c0_g1_i1:76-2514(-)